MGRVWGICLSSFLCCILSAVHVPKCTATKSAPKAWPTQKCVVLSIFFSSADRWIWAREQHVSGVRGLVHQWVSFFGTSLWHGILYQRSFEASTKSVLCAFASKDDKEGGGLIQDSCLRQFCFFLACWEAKQRSPKQAISRKVRDWSWAVTAFSSYLQKETSRPLDRLFRSSFGQLWSFSFILTRSHPEVVSQLVSLQLQLSLHSILGEWGKISELFFNFCSFAVRTSRFWAGWDLKPKKQGTLLGSWGPQIPVQKLLGFFLGWDDEDEFCRN